MPRDKKANTEQPKKKRRTLRQIRKEAAEKHLEDFCEATKLPKKAGLPNLHKPHRHTATIDPKQMWAFFRRRIVAKLMQEGFMGEDLNLELKKRIEELHPNMRSDWEPSIIRKDILWVKIEWKKADQEMMPVFRSRQRRELYEVARELREEKAWNQWIRVQELISRIDGTEQPREIETQEHDEFEGWTIEELEHYAQTGEAPTRIFDGSSHRDWKENERDKEIGRTVH